MMVTETRTELYRRNELADVIQDIQAMERHGWAVRQIMPGGLPDYRHATTVVFEREKVA